MLRSEKVSPDLVEAGRPPRFLSKQSEFDQFVLPVSCIHVASEYLQQRLTEGTGDGRLAQLKLKCLKARLLLHTNTANQWDRLRAASRRALQVYYGSNLGLQSRKGVTQIHGLLEGR